MVLEEQRPAVPASFTKAVWRLARKQKARAPGWLSRLRVQLLISAQGTISQLVRWSPALGSVLTGWSLLEILCLTLSLSLSLSLKINKFKQQQQQQREEGRVCQDERECLLKPDLLL